jgi:hypothetical protein
MGGHFYPIWGSYGVLGPVFRGKGGPRGGLGGLNQPCRVALCGQLARRGRGTRWSHAAHTDVDIPVPLTVIGKL